MGSRARRRPPPRRFQIRNFSGFEEETYQLLEQQHPDLDRHRLHQVLCSHYRYGFAAQVKRRVAGAAQEIQIKLLQIKRRPGADPTLEIGEINRLLQEMVGLVTRDAGPVIVPPATSGRAAPPAR
jgi:hypothetical protein